MKKRIHFNSRELLAGKTPEQLGLDFTRVRRFELAAGGEAAVETAENELCAVLLKGGSDFRCRLAGGRTETGAAVFKDMLFLPPGSRLELAGEAVLLTFEAPSESGANGRPGRRTSTAGSAKRSTSISIWKNPSGFSSYTKTP